MSVTICYHVTSPEVAEIIVSEGFAGGWGDDGFGVYLFDDLVAAEAYAARGGWDGAMEQTAIVKVEAPDCTIWPIDVHPEWPDPEAYDNVVVHPMQDMDATDRWKPRMCILRDEPEEPEL